MQPKTMQPQIMQRNTPRNRGLAIATLLLLACCGGAFAHTVANPTPFHLSPGDYFRIDVAGAVFGAIGDVQLQFTPSGGGATTNAAAEDVTPNAAVGVRVPAGLAVGQYQVGVAVSGIPSDAPGADIWVRERTISFIKQSSVHLTGHPSATFKDADFGDLNADGFLDVFEANSSSNNNLDRVHINKLGGDPKPAGCSASADFCDETTTLFENTVAGVPNNDRTYDADIVDLDLDGDLDVVRIDRSLAGNITGAVTTPMRVFLNDGSGNLEDRTITRAGVGPALLPPMADMRNVSSNTAEVDVGDVNGDGRPDLIACSWGGSQNLLLINRLHAAEGRFVIANDDPCTPSASAHALCEIRPAVNRGCAFGHFNTDDLLDIVLPSMGSDDSDYVLLNTGNMIVAGVPIPQFDVRTDWVDAAGGSNADDTNGADLKVADLDGDGDDDVIVVSPRGEEKRRILWNDAGTRLVELADARYSPNGDTYDVDLADLDRDGDIDLAMTHELGSSDPVMINRGGLNGAMLFDELSGSNLWFELLPGNVVGPSSASFSLSVSFGDYDLDGDIDLLSGGGPTRLWKNTLFDGPGEDRDWVFVLDKTRSMISGGRDFFEPAKNVIQAFLSQRRPGDEVGLVTFDYTGPDSGNAAAADDVNKAQLISSVGTQTAADLATDVGLLAIGSCTGQCTAIGWAIKTGKEAAEVAPDPDREKVVVLVTDGRQNQAPHPDTIIPTIPSNIRLYTVALGTNTDDRMLSALATNGGKFFFAGRSSDYETVQSVLREVDNDIESDATGKQVLSSFQRLQWAKNYLAILQESPLLRVKSSDNVLNPLLQPRQFVNITDTLQTAVDAFYVDPDDSQVRFTLSWRHPSDTNAIQLVDPAGRSYPLAGSDLYRESRLERAHVIEVLDPLSGVWRVQRIVDQRTGPSKLTAMASSALEVLVQPHFPLFYVGEPLRLDAVLGRAPLGSSGELRLLSPSKRETLVRSTAISEGLRFSTEDLTESGSYWAEVIVMGPPSRPFARSWRSAIHVAEPTNEEPDLRAVQLSLDRSVVTAGGGDSSTATLRATRRDGQPLLGAKVSFAALNGRFTGVVQDLGGGRYSQAFVGGDRAAPGTVTARVDLARLPNQAPFEVRPKAADPSASRLELLVGPLVMCTNERGPFGVRAYPTDDLGNSIRGADVAIEQNLGPNLSWLGAAAPVFAGDVYERRFEAPREAGRYTFTASADGVTFAQTVSMDVFDPGTPDAEIYGCTSDPVPTSPGSVPWWIWLLLLLLLFALLVWWILKS